MHIIAWLCFEIANLLTCYADSVSRECNVAIASGVRTHTQGQMQDFLKGGSLRSS